MLSCSRAIFEQLGLDNNNDPGQPVKIRLFQVDAFTDRAFSGNPAAVCPLDRWPHDALMQAIAAENNLSETAFFVPRGAEYELRWFTPKAEVDLCGHATLATAFVIFTELGSKADQVVFHTRSGELRVARATKGLVMDFPAETASPCDVPDDLLAGLGGSTPRYVLCTRERYLVVYSDEAEVASIVPDFTLLMRLPLRGVIVSAPSDAADFVSRYFAPKVGVNEDPVTGSAHCVLAPYWAARLGKGALRARQISQRGGDLHCELRNDRVLIAGQAVLFLRGEIML